MPVHRRLRLHRAGAGARRDAPPADHRRHRPRRRRRHRARLCARRHLVPVQADELERLPPPGPLRAEGGAGGARDAARQGAGGAHRRVPRPYARGAGEGDRRRRRRDLRVRRRLGGHGRPGGARPSCATAGERLSSALRKVHRVSGIVTGEAVLERERVRAADVAADAMRRTARARSGPTPRPASSSRGAVDRELFCDRRLAAVALERSAAERARLFARGQEGQNDRGRGAARSHPLRDRGSRAGHPGGHARAAGPDELAREPGSASRPHA